ncbi:MAG: hypothetical protein K0Q91_685 [Fibrobacteria bacterium]|jgi:hypothetical protein|nr:hypothetical protein [Fibrobacteria bacterium]
MPDNLSTAQAVYATYWLAGGLAAVLGLQFVWIHFVAYPARFERMLRKGRTWVYIPQRWKGFYKVQVLFVSRLLVIGATLLAVFLMVQYTDNRKPLWVAAYAVAAYVAAAWAGAAWSSLRYRQQEDAYFLQLDELRAKFDLENKDYSDAQLRNLSAYQHQQKLHRADEEGKLLAVIRDEARRFRRAKPAALPEA